MRANTAKLHVFSIQDISQQDTERRIWNDIVRVAYATLEARDAKNFLVETAVSPEHSFHVAQFKENEVVGLIYRRWCHGKTGTYVEISRLIVDASTTLRNQRKILLSLLQYLQEFPWTLHLLNVYPSSLEDTVSRLFDRNRFGRGWLANTAQLHRNKCTGS